MGEKKCEGVREKKWMANFLEFSGQLSNFRCLWLALINTA